MSSTVSSAPNRRVLVVASLVAALAVVGGVVWWLHASKASTSAAAGSQASDSKDDNGVSILLDLAQTAVKEKRLVAPAGSNAYEFYESFPAASADVERAINDNSLDEAQRELSLLREFDSTNYILSLLGGKLDAQRQIQIRQDEARAAVIQAQQSAGGPAQ
jgi:protein TonB